MSKNDGKAWRGVEARVRVRAKAREGGGSGEVSEVHLGPVGSEDDLKTAKE
jgi:hypothetical protein